jgi:hypothetical protein
MNLTTIRAALETRLLTVSGLRAYSEWPDKPEFPCAIVTADDPYIEPHMTFGSNRAMQVNYVVSIVVAIAASAGVDRAQRALDGFVAESVLDAVYGSDRTLGGVVQDTLGVSISGLKQMPIAGGQYVGHELSLQLITRHS